MVRDAMVVPFESVCLWLIEGADIVRTFDVCLQLICFCFFFLLYIFFVFQKRQVTLLPWQWIIMTVWVVTIKVNAAMGMDDFENFRQRTKLNSIFFVFCFNRKRKTFGCNWNDRVRLTSVCDIATKYARVRGMLLLFGRSSYLKYPYTAHIWFSNWNPLIAYIYCLPLSISISRLYPIKVDADQYRPSFIRYIANNTATVILVYLIIKKTAREVVFLQFSKQFRKWRWNDTTVCKENDCAV